MLNHPTIAQLDALGFAGMATAFKELAANPDAKGLDHAALRSLLASLAPQIGSIVC